MKLHHTNINTGDGCTVPVVFMHYIYGWNESIDLTYRSNIIIVFIQRTDIPRVLIVLYDTLMVSSS